VCPVTVSTRSGFNRESPNRIAKSPNQIANQIAKSKITNPKIKKPLRRLAEEALGTVPFCFGFV
jgi:hypothetical protein